MVKKDVEFLKQAASSARDLRWFLTVRFNTLPAGTTKEKVELAMRKLNEIDADLGTEAHVLERHGE